MVRRESPRGHRETGLPPLGIDPLAPAMSETGPETVIIVGPPTSMVGGMASVVEQIAGLDFGERYGAELFPSTSAPGPHQLLIGRFWRHLRHACALDATIRRSRAAIAHIHTCSGFSFFRSVLDMIIARRRGCRTILHIHGAAFDAFYDGAGWITRRLIEWSLGHADRVVALSESWQRQLRDMAPDARLWVIENAVSAPSSVPKRQHNRSCRFLLLARMDEWKGIDDLLDACGRLRAEKVVFELVLAGPSGTAGDSAVLNRKFRDLELDAMVRYVGSVHGEDKSNLLQWSDVYVQPSHHEGMPLSLLEALAYGLPIVATRVGAVPEVVTDRREGLLVPPRDPGCLASAMRELSRDVDRRRTMARAARELALSRFGLDRFRRDLLKLYDDVGTASSGHRQTKGDFPAKQVAQGRRGSGTAPAASPSAPR